MIGDFAAIERHRAEVTHIDGNALVLSGGTRRVVDALLWGTGYTMDLSYFAVDALAGITRQEDLRKRCNELFASSDAQGLYFLAPSVLESTTSTTWAYAHACRSIVSEISGSRRVFGRDSITDNVSYFDLAKFLAKRDRKHFPRYSGI